MKWSFLLFFALINLSDSLTRQEREQRVNKDAKETKLNEHVKRSKRRQMKKEKQDKKAHSLGYHGKSWPFSRRVFYKN